MDSDVVRVARTAERSYLVTLHGEVYFGSLGDSRLAATRTAIPPASEVTVDLSDAEFLDSSALGMLVALRNDAASLRVRNTPRRLMRTFIVSGLADMLVLDEC